MKGLFSFLKTRRKSAADLEKRSFEAGFTLSQMVSSTKGFTGLNVSAYSMLGVAAIFAAVRIRGETLSNIPFREVEKRGHDCVESDDPWLLELLQNSPDGQITAVEFFQSMESHSCLTGCAYAHIERNIYGEPVRLVQVPSYDVSQWLDDYAQPDQHLEYNVRGKRVSSRDLIIIPFGQVYPYWQTMRPQVMLHTPIALAQALDREAYDLFKNGVSSGGVLQMDGTMTDDVAARLREYLNQYRSGGSKAGSMLVLENGLKYVAARMTNKDAEFVDLKKQAIRDAGAIFSVPSYLLGDGEKKTYASQEEENRNFLYSAMLSRARLFENELTNKLLTREARMSGKRIRADLRGLMRGSMKDRAEYYQKLFQMGAISPNTIAELEELPSMGPDGDKHYVQVNMAPIEAPTKSGEEIDEGTTTEGNASI